MLLVTEGSRRRWRSCHRKNSERLHYLVLVSDLKIECEQAGKPPACLQDHLGWQEQVGLDGRKLGMSLTSISAGCAIRMLRQGHGHGLDAVNRRVAPAFLSRGYFGDIACIEVVHPAEVDISQRRTATETPDKP